MAASNWLAVVRKHLAADKIDEVIDVNRASHFELVAGSYFQYFYRQCKEFSL